jgi:4-hydroxybenzoate polyprenyltransferase
MKKILCLFLSVFILFWTISPICFAQEKLVDRNKGKATSARRFAEHNPAKLLDVIYNEANNKYRNSVQNTRYDNVSSRWWCADTRFTISNTLCSLKSLSKGYLQYFIYIWLVAATFLIIRNWFILVTSPDREKQLTKFKKNIMYIVIWVILLIWFYYIIDFFVSIVNLIADK